MSKRLAQHSRRTTEPESAAEPPRRVRSVMSSPVLRVAPTDGIDLAEAALALARSHHVPVVDGRRLVGVISDRDLLRAGHGAPLTAQHVMTRRPSTIGQDEPVEVAASIMLERDISCLPVVEDGELLGIVTSRDLLAVAIEALSVAEQASSSPIPVRELVRRHPLVKVDVEEQLDLATLQIHRGHVRALPVMRGDIVAGVIGDRDILRVLGRPPGDVSAARLWRNKTVAASEIMSSPAYTLQANASARSAAEALRQVDQVVVLDGAQLVGFLCDRDFLKIVSSRPTPWR